MANDAHSYQIRPETIKSFIEDRTIRLPRFQRKQTWNETKDFALAISVFKGFPLGVVVINREFDSDGKPVKWLLDGRQRRNALRNMLLDPEALYVWAKKFIRFQSKDELSQIRDKFWEEIEKYLGADDDEEQSDTEGQNISAMISEPSADAIEAEGPEEVQDSEVSISRVEAKSVGGRYQGLETLLEIILLSHRKSKLRSGFTRPFDFDFIDALDYVEAENGDRRLNARKLRTWMLGYRDYCVSRGEPYLQMESFLQFLETRYKVTEPKHRKKIERNWSEIQERFEALETIENKLQDTEIGLIQLSGANPSDAQITFKIINSTGTPLEAVEILSAKPSWNVPITNPSESLLQATRRLYVAIGEVTQEGVVRWDAPATLASRLSNLRFVFSEFDYANEKQLGKSITLGFKLVAALHQSGISKDHIDALSRNEKINWQLAVDALERDLNTIGKIVSEDIFFEYFSSWKISLMDLTSNAVAIDFVVRLYKDWERKGKPYGAGGQTKVFLKNARILFDTLIYEYLTRQWRGSSDSRIADHIKNFPTQLDLYQPRAKGDWSKLIDEVIDKHEMAEKRLETKKVDLLLKPLLYYHYVLRQQAGPTDLKVSIEVDHIIPQDTLDSSPLPEIESKAHNLFNLALLPKKDNIAKRAKALSELRNEWLEEQVSKYTAIPKEDFAKYSSVQSMDELRQFRKKVFKEAFGGQRDKLLIG